MRLVPIDGHLHQRIQAISGGCGRVAFLPINKKRLDRLFNPDGNSSTGKCKQSRASKNQTNKELTDRTSCERWIAFQVSSLVALGDMLFTPGSGFVVRHRFQAGFLSAFRLLRFLVFRTTKVLDWAGGTAGLYGADLGWGGCGARTALDEGPLHFVVLCVALLCDNGFVFGVTVTVFGLLVCMQVCVHAAGGLLILGVGCGWCEGVDACISTCEVASCMHEYHAS